jgi:DNA-directed RNA polymerase specialized sigma24 family protein
MDKPLVGIIYKTADGKQICVDVSIEVKNLLEQTDRQIRSQRRQDRRYLDFVECVDDLDSVTTLPHEDIADLVSRIDGYTRLYSAVGKLSMSQKRRVYLYYFCDQICQEIANAENVHHSAITRSLQRAVKTMKRHLVE